MSPEGKSPPNPGSSQVRGGKRLGTEMNRGATRTTHPPGTGKAEPREMLLGLGRSAVGREALTDPAAAAGNQRRNGLHRKLRLPTDGAHVQRLQLPEASAGRPQNAWQHGSFLIRKKPRNSYCACPQAYLPASGNYISQRALGLENRRTPSLAGASGEGS